MAYENNEKRQESVYSTRIKAGKRRTYFFDVRATRANDYFLTITESRKRFDQDGYERSKLFLYKEDFNKFIKGLQEAVDHVKTELMPDFDFDAFNHDDQGDDREYATVQAPASHTEAAPDSSVAITADVPATDVITSDTPVNVNDITEEVDKW